ncbi:MAG: hypothetical protein JWO98_1949 [Frankiales bacterium]|nr:hypothetical protein [Frankiales bacterium]
MSTTHDDVPDTRSNFEVERRHEVGSPVQFVTPGRGS